MSLRSGVFVLSCLSLALSLAVSAEQAAFGKESKQEGAKEEKSYGEGRKGNWRRNAQGAPSLEASRKRVKENPNSADAHNDLGWALRQNGKLKEAEAELRKALELDDTIPYGHSNLSVVLLDSGKVDEAVSEAERAVGIDDKSPIYHVVYGNALDAAKSKDKAVEQYQAAVKLKPDYENALYNLGRVLNDQGKTAEASAVLSQALELDPNDARVMKLLDKLLK